MTTIARLRQCGHTRIASAVEVRQGDGVAHFTGLKTCGLLWVCPMCGPKIRQGRAVEIEAALTAAVRQGCGVEFVTLTNSHHRGHALGQLLDGSQAAWRAARKDRAVEALFAQLDYWGVVQVVEITHGENGWHPHRHMAMVFGRPLSPADRAKLEQTLWEAWEKALHRRGFTALRRYGTVVRPVTLAEGLAGYLAKVDQERSIGQEMARGDLKVSRRHGLTPMELLAEALDTGEIRLVHLWQEYERATSGRKMMTWTPNLRRRLVGLVDDDVSDQELAEAEVGGEVMAVLWADAWGWIRDTPDGGLGVLEAAERGAAALEDYLRSILPFGPGDGLWAVFPDTT